MEMEQDVMKGRIGEAGEMTGEGVVTGGYFRGCFLLRNKKR